jgi:hypothetical protein
LLGWALAGVGCIPAALFVGTARWHHPLRQALASAARVMADLLSAPVGTVRARSDQAAVERALATLRSQYEATPYRPTGAGPTDVALTNLMPRLEWVGECAGRATVGVLRPDDARLVAAVSESAADVLYAVADLLLAKDPEARSAASESLALGVDRLAAAREVATDIALAEVIERADGRGGSDGSEGSSEVVISGPLEVLADIDPTYPTRMLAFALEMMAEVAFDAQGPRESDGNRIDRWRTSARYWFHVAAGQGGVGSVWFRNAMRGRWPWPSPSSSPR